ncbi:hypothetical protein [Catenulispora rubra]|nr:hypothetical protein [Catenulispora rubra]
MGKVFTALAVSVDGYITGRGSPHENVPLVLLSHRTDGITHLRYEVQK